MEKKFKYSIFANFTNMQIADDFIEELEKLNYKEIKNNFLDEKSIQIKINPSTASMSDCKNGEYFISIFNTENSYNRRDFTFNIDNKWEFEAALAVAAIHDDSLPHIGEWIKYLGAGSSLKSQNGLWKILKTDGEKGLFLENSPYNWGLHYADIKFDERVRKAAPEEIIEFMKEKYNTFELPKKWCIANNNAKPYADIRAYFDSYYGWEIGWNYNGYYKHIPSVDRGGKSGLNFDFIQEGYTIITYEQWKNWYDNQQKQENLTDMNKKQEKTSFSIKGPINKYPDLHEWFSVQKGGRYNGESSSYYNYNVNTESTVCISTARFSIITYEQWKEMYGETEKEKITIPSNWCVKGSDSLGKLISEFKDTKNETKKIPANIAGSFNYYYYIQTINNKGEQDWNYTENNCPSNKVEVSFEIFEKWFKQEFMNTEDKVIIGYKLIKEYPNSRPVGTVYTENFGLCAKYPEIYEAIYEEVKKETKLEIGCDESFGIVISKGSDIIVAPERDIDIKHLINLRNEFQKLSKFNNWGFSVNTVNIGCKKNIPFSYLDTIIEEWNKLND